MRPTAFVHAFAAVSPLSLFSAFFSLESTGEYLGMVDTEMEMQKCHSRFW